LTNIDKSNFDAELFGIATLDSLTNKISVKLDFCRKISIIVYRR
jgi:hypothetical protein